VGERRDGIRNVAVTVAVAVRTQKRDTGIIRIRRIRTVVELVSVESAVLIAIEPILTPEPAGTQV
jgi:hypothetical protein